MPDSRSTPVRLTVVGSVNLDLIARGAPLPRPGQTVTGATFDRSPGGKGANQALAARRQGADVCLVAAVGTDPLADEALALLGAEGVDLESVERIDDAATGVALITVDPAGENQITVAPGANHRVAVDAVNAAFVRRPADAVLVQFELPDDALDAAARAAGSALFCVNAAPARPFSAAVLERADVVIVNEGEYAELAESLASFAGLLIVTLGARGAEARRSGTTVARATPPVVQAVDTVGAGDAFCGAFVVSLAGGAEVETALRRGCVAGALAATRPGAQPSLPSAADTDALLATGA